MLGFVTKKGAKKSLSKAFLSKDFAPALEKHRRLFEKYPSDPGVLNDLSLLLMESKKADEAVTCLKKAISLEETSLYWNNLGRAQLICGDLDAAHEAFQRAKQLDSNNIEAWYNVSASLREQGDVDASVAELQKLVEKFPDFEKAHNDLAMYYEEQGDHVLASRHLHLALLANPDYIVARLNAIRVLCTAGHYNEAKEHIAYVRDQGVRIEDDVDGDTLTINIHGNTFFQGLVGS